MMDNSRPQQRHTTTVMPQPRGRHMAQPAPSYITIRGRPGDGANFGETDSTYGSQQGGPCSSPPRRATHNISKAQYHMADVGHFARTLEESATKAFPNRGRSTARYTKVQVLLLHWESDDLFVLPEVQDLGKCFADIYHYGVEYFMIPTDNSHLELMMKIGIFLKQFESPDTLLIVYYGGHARIDESRQSTWCATRDRDSPWLQWSAIQTLLERSPSDILILLDCCAGAASATFPNGDSVTETISASSWDAIAPDPGRYSFTSTLLEVLADWDKRVFSAAMLHAEVLARLKHPRPELRNGRHFEARATPVHFMMTANHKKPSIEMAVVRSEDSLAASPRTVSPGAVPTITATAAPGYDTLDPPPHNRGPMDGNEAKEYEQEPSVTTPHVMISLALEKDQRLDLNAWEQWLSNFPALAKYVKVQGVFESHSSLLLLSLPVGIWNMLPENDACNFVAFIRSNNLAAQTTTASATPTSVPVTDVSSMVVESGAPDAEHPAPPENLHQDDASFFTSLTGSTAVVRVEPFQSAAAGGPVPVTELVRHRTLPSLPGPEVAAKTTPVPIVPVRSGTTVGLLNKKLSDMKSTLSLNQSRSGNPLKQSPSSPSLQSMQPKGGSGSCGSSMAYQAIMTQARATRRTHMIGESIPEGPGFADHVEAQLEKFYYGTDNKYPSDGLKETLASNLGVEARDLTLWFHRKHTEAAVSKRFQKLKMDDAPASPTSSISSTGVRMILPGHLSKLLEMCPPSQLLVVDVRSSTEFQRSHIYGALNWRVPTRVISVADEGMLDSALGGEEQRKTFKKWKEVKCVLFYDRQAEYAWEVPQTEALVEWMRSRGWEGQGFLLKGPYMEVQLNQRRYIVGAKMGPEAEEWVRDVEGRVMTPEDMSMIQDQYDDWLRQIGEEDRVPHSTLAPGKLDERRAGVEEKQRALEKEFSISQEKVWLRAMQQQLADDDVGGGEQGESFGDNQAALVEHLSRGLEKMREAGIDMPPAPSSVVAAPGIGKMTLDAGAPPTKISAVAASAGAGKKGKGVLVEEGEYDIVGEHEDEDGKEEVNPMGLGRGTGRGGPPQQGKVIRGFTDRLFGRKEGR